MPAEAKSAKMSKPMPARELHRERERKRENKHTLTLECAGGLRLMHSPTHIVKKAAEALCSEDPPSPFTDGCSCL